MFVRSLVALLLPLVLFAFGGFPKFLEPQDAFKPEVSVDKNANIVAKIVLGEQIYIYKDKMRFELKDADGLKIKKISSPKSIKHEEDEVYEGTPTFIIELEKSKELSGVQKVKFLLGFQGCSAMGLCYEPEERIYELSIDTSKVPLAQSSKKAASKSEKSSQDSIADTLKNGSIWLIVATFFGFGLLLALTPCVFPMIPIISGLIVSQGEGITTKRAFFLSVVYVLAMAVAYTIAGVLAGLFGSNLQAALQNPYVVVAFSAVFVALALSMFGFYELKLPDRFVTRVSETGQGKGGVIGVAVMGFLSALIVGPCVAAPLAGALVYIGQTGDALLGGVALFAMSLGMGLPLIVVGTGAGRFMPKPGAWMTLVNAIFGILMLGVAIWMLAKILDPYYVMLLWAILGLGTALYLGAFDKESHIFKRTVAFGVFLYSLALFAGAFAGHVSMTQPLGFLKGSSFAMQQGAPKPRELDFKVVTNLSELEALLQKNRGKKILIDFSAKWCTACKELEEITFKDPKVISMLQEFVLVRADVTKNSPEQKEMSKKFGVFGPPVILFIDETGKLLRSKTIVGYIAPDAFIKQLQTL